MIHDITVGIFQGRCVPSRNRGIQFFPFEEWQDEFRVVGQLGFDEMEFIFDKERFEENPLWSETGINKIQQLVDQSGVKIRHVCADFFMREPFHKIPTKVKKKNVQVLKRLLYSSKAVGAQAVEVPFLDNSSIKSEDEKLIVEEVLLECLEEAKKLDLLISLETDLEPNEYLRLLKSLNQPNLRITYDSGNSASLGYNPKEEIDLLGPYINNFHLKDRLYGSGTVPLGTGDADLKAVFLGLKKIGYRGSMTLQAAREKDGEEETTIRRQLDFLENNLVDFCK